MEKTNRASFEFSLRWKSKTAVHKDRFFAERIDFWCDIFPDDMGENLIDLFPGESLERSFDKGVLTPKFRENKIVSFPLKEFETKRNNTIIKPKEGRFYPQGFAWKALHCFPGNINPFRIVKIENDKIIADTNHPLSKFPLTLSAHMIQKLPPAEQRGGTCNSIDEMVTSYGPGMQIPYPGTETDFYSNYPFESDNSEDDSSFYETPRLVNHLDDTAIHQVESIYGNILKNGSKVLDLMSSWKSHLPESLKELEVTGLGMNSEELEKNNKLTDFVIHDLNRKTDLPFDDNTFDAVICTSSIEYLINPLKTIAEIVRITKKGGIFISTFSDRWFPGKEITIWKDMHPFERQGLVLDYYLKSGSFENLHTESVTGLPRPFDDKYIIDTYISDPVYAVWGYIS